MSVEQELTNLKQIVEAAQSAAKEAQAAACAATARCRNLEAKVSDLISEAAFRHSYEDRAAAKRVGTQLYRWCYKRWEASGRWSDMQFDDVYKRWEEFTAEATDEEWTLLQAKGFRRHKEQLATLYFRDPDFTPEDFY